MQTKSIFKSKTAIAGFLTAIAGAASHFVPGIEQFIQSNAGGILLAVGGLNIGLRFVTRGRIVLFES